MFGLNHFFIEQTQNKTVNDGLAKKFHEVENQRIFPAVVGVEKTNSSVHSIKSGGNANFAFKKSIAVIEQGINWVAGGVLGAFFPLPAILV